MKFLDFEWKMLNAYHVIVRRKTSDEQLDAVYSNNNYSSIHYCLSFSQKWVYNCIKWIREAIYLILKILLMTTVFCYKLEISLDFYARFLALYDGSAGPSRHASVLVVIKLF